MDDETTRWKSATVIHRMPKYHHKAYLKVTKGKRYNFTGEGSGHHPLNREFNVSITNGVDYVSYCDTIWGTQHYL